MERVCEDEYDLLNLINVNKSYKMSNTKILAMDNINISIRKGEIVGLVGESGCGKSTLARAIVGLEKIDCGEICFEGKKINHKDLKEFRKKVQLIFQDSISSLDPKISIINSVFEPLDILYRKRSDENTKKVKQILDEVGIHQEHYNKFPSQLSGGQCQRVAIARALTLSPKMLICDEITSALDVINQYRIVDKLNELSKEHGISVLFITHNINLAKTLCDRLIIMKSGKVMEQGKTDVIINNPSNEYTKLLISMSMMEKGGENKA